MKRLSPVDSTFLIMESTRTPMHVGSMMTFKMPKNAPPDYFQKMIEVLRSEPFLPAPFDCKLAEGRLSKVLPAWEKTEVDPEYHVRHSALPKPGGERELGVLVSRLHSHPMDFDRPLWEVHLIEGLYGRRFAFYFKAHHCAIDGMAAMSMTKKWLKTDPEDMSAPGYVPPKPHASSSDRKKIALFKDVLAKASESAKGAGELGKNMISMAQGSDSMIKASRNTPRSLFNAPVNQQRRLGTQVVALSRFKAISKALDVTVNDVTLAVIGGATRKYLKEYNALPKQSLTASVPIGLDRDENAGGNAVAGFVCPLGTDIPDPLQRVQKINRATKRAKSDLLKMSRPALDNLALSGLGPLLVGQVTGTLSKMAPMFNFVVSNVVLTKHKLYLMGAELEAMYPMSFLFDGYALNVTVIGYTDKVAIGFIGCRDAIPKLQSLAVYAGDALDELEVAAGLKKPKNKPQVVLKSPRKKPTARRSTAKKKA